jgi:hypothetical protein
MSKIHNISEYRSKYPMLNELQGLRRAYNELHERYEIVDRISLRLTKYLVFSVIINVLAVIYIWVRS